MLKSAKGRPGPEACPSSVSGRCGECAVSVQAHCPKVALKSTRPKMTAQYRDGGRPQLLCWTAIALSPGWRISLKTSPRARPASGVLARWTVSADPSRRRSAPLKVRRYGKLGPGRPQIRLGRHQRDDPDRARRGGSGGSDIADPTLFVAFPLPRLSAARDCSVPRQGHGDPKFLRLHAELPRASLTRSWRHLTFRTARSPHLD